MTAAPDTYRGWEIHQGRWPEPAWSAFSPNYDASYEGPEDGWVDNGEKAEADTRAALLDEIDAWFEYQADRSPSITLRFAIGLAVLATALIGAHAVWAANGMPTPDNLFPVMEMLNV